MTFDDVISVSAAARQIGCSRTTLYRAVGDGRLTAVKVGDRKMIVKDEDWESFEPKRIGGRVQMLNKKDDNGNQ